MEPSRVQVLGAKLDSLVAMKYLVFKCVVHQFVYHVLVNLLITFAGTSSAYRRQPHHAEAQQRDFISRCRVRPVSHLACGG